MPHFKKLLEPGFIGPFRLKNRILKMGSTLGFYPWQDGHIQQEVIDAYENLAKGGVALVTVGAAPFGVPPGRGYLMDDDRFLPDMARLAEAIRKHDCIALVQAFHIGPMLPPFLRSEKLEPVAASSLRKEELPLPFLSPPRGLEKGEIKRIIEDFVSLAVRAKKAGFQGIEINAACNHFLNTFLSRAWNKRDDEYGPQNIENRARILTEILEGIRSENGRDFLIVVLINGAEIGLKDGITPEESRGIAQVLEKAGADAINIRAEFYFPARDPSRKDSTHFPDVALYPEPPFPVKGLMDERRYGRGGWVPLAHNVKKGVSIPVIVAGRLDPLLAEEVLEKGFADFVYLNRALMADPELPKKLLEGRFEDVRPCTGCLTCFDNNERGNPPLCQVNPTLGKEKALEVWIATKRKKVLVIGGGPAGMEAARTAALRGHQVLLCDKSPRLGGSMLLASIVKGLEREDHLKLISYYERQLKKLKVEIRLNLTVDRSFVEKVAPDVLIVAVGGAHQIPSVPGIGGKKVLTGKALQEKLRFFLRFFGPKALISLSHIWMPIGKRVAIIGGQIQGCQLAEFLVKRGRKVWVLEETTEVGKGLPEVLIKPRLLDWLEAKGVRILSEAKVKRIHEKGVEVSIEGLRDEFIEVDTVITALPLLPNERAVKEFEGLAPEVYAIGDCKEPQLIVDAIAAGFNLGRTI